MSASHTTVRWTPLGYLQLTNLSVATGFGPLVTVIPVNTVMALISVEGAAVRWRDDGVAPTATVGMPLAVGQEFAYTPIDFTIIQFIQQVGGAILNVSFYK